MMTHGLYALWGDRAPIILVPLDGSAEAKGVLPMARSIARIEEASIHVVHAAEQPLPEWELLRRMSLRREEARGVVVGQAVGPVVADAIVRLAEEMRAMLIAMTTHGRSACLGGSIRPVPEQTVQRATSPVLLVRPGAVREPQAPCSLRRILLPMDGAPSSAAIIGPALDLARHCEAEVYFLYVATLAGQSAEPGTLTVPRYLDQPQHEWPNWTNEFLGRFGTALGGSPSPTPARLFLRRGEPSAEILRFAGERECDLIVLGWRGHSDPARARVVRTVLREAGCPVLLLRSPAPAAACR
jgi:nucleotide-binding universal stress UspA family protein